ncbi:nuclear transport factor 2 family protein [Hyphomicrobium sp.]|uniref:nuclear transport factor 2 family protein n=1 Tax=Hyphomicrobium sp. TaxID=82 RepID=UPI003F7057CF
MENRVGAVANTAMLVYAAGHLDAFMEMLTDDIVYALYLDEAVVTFAGETQGKAAFRERIAQMHQAFEYVLYRPLGVHVLGDVVHGQVEFMYRHRVTQEMLTGRFRLVVTVAGERLSRIEEYHDAERVKAFMRLVGSAEPD